MAVMVLEQCDWNEDNPNENYATCIGVWDVDHVPKKNREPKIMKIFNRVSQGIPQGYEMEETVPKEQWEWVPQTNERQYNTFVLSVREDIKIDHMPIIKLNPPVK